MSDKPILIPLEDGTWQLAEDFGEVPKVFVTDGGSIPRFFWRVVGAPMDPQTCADSELYHDLREAGVGRARATAIYLAVRACGWRHYGKN